jgi:hypothetical protein
VSDALAISRVASDPGFAGGLRAWGLVLTAALATLVTLPSPSLAQRAEPEPRPTLSRENPRIDLYDDEPVEELVWEHPAGPLLVEVRVVRRGGPCELRVGGRRLASVDVTDSDLILERDEGSEEHEPGACPGSVAWVDEGDLLVSIVTAYGDEADPGGGESFLVARDAGGRAVLTSSGAWAGAQLTWMTGHGSDEAIARAVRACVGAESSEGVRAAWTRLDALRATEAERGGCGERRVELLLAASSACGADDLDAESRMSCFTELWREAARLEREPALASRARSLRAIADIARSQAAGASRQVLAALPELTPSTTEQFLAATYCLRGLDDCVSLAQLGLDAEQAELDRFASAAERYERCASEGDPQRRARIAAELEAASAPRSLVAGCAGRDPAGRDPAGRDPDATVRAPSTPESAPRTTGIDLPEAPSRDVVMSALQGVSGEAAACSHDRGGFVQVRVVFESSGRVSSALVVAGDLPASARSCVERAVRAARVPPFRQPSVSVHFPFRAR